MTENPMLQNLEELRQQLIEPHCWHLQRGPSWMVLPDGQISQTCCKCPATRTIHKEHQDDR